jgi:hypothetical protein
MTQHKQVLSFFIMHDLSRTKCMTQQQRAQAACPGANITGLQHMQVTAPQPISSHLHRCATGTLHLLQCVATNQLALLQPYIGRLAATP